MGNLSYTDLNLKIDNSITTFDFNGKTIEVLKYLPIESKYDLVMITLQKSFENGIYNPVKLNMYFLLNLVYLYTNLSFTDEDRADEGKLFDELSSNGFLDKLLTVIDEDEYNSLYSDIIETIDNINEYNLSAAGVLKGVINDLPINASEAMKIVDNFNPEKYQEVIKFAEAANGGKPIPLAKYAKPSITE
jgi:hypothetical protein